MNYLAAANIITNDVYLLGDSPRKAIVGGSGIFALAGMKVWSDRCAILANAGRDFRGYYSRWFEANGLAMDCVLDDYCDETLYRALYYHPDGSYTSVDLKPIPPGGLQQYLNPPVENIGAHAGRDTAVYTVCIPDTDYWDALIAAKGERGFRIMWEYAGLAVGDRAGAGELWQERGRVLEFAAHIEMFSINYNEASRLFDEPGEDKLVEMFKAFPSPFVLFRCGDRGLYTITGGRAYRIPALIAPDYVDQTGCGNCSTGASMVAHCEGRDPVMTGIMANVAAHYNVKQFGPYPAMTAAKRAEATAWAEELRARYDEATASFR